MDGPSRLDVIAQLAARLNQQFPGKKHVIYRGSPLAQYMIVGEAPGKIEEKEGEPFKGPAGELLDKIMSSVMLDTNTDFYITNIVKFRPAMPRGSGRENRPPTVEEIRNYLPYLQEEIHLIQPALVVLTGLSAAKGVLGATAKGKTMFELGGKFTDTPDFPGTRFYTIYHPAALLHAKPDPVKYTLYREKMWLHVRILRNEIDKIEGLAVTYPELN